VLLLRLHLIGGVGELQGQSDAGRDVFGGGQGLAVPLVGYVVAVVVTAGNLESGRNAAVLSKRKVANLRDDILASFDDIAESLVTT